MLLESFKILVNLKILDLFHKTAYKQGNFIIEDHFTHLGKMVDIDFKTSRNIADINYLDTLVV